MWIINKQNIFKTLLAAIVIISLIYCSCYKNPFNCTGGFSGYTIVIPLKATSTLVQPLRYFMDGQMDYGYTGSGVVDTVREDRISYTYECDLNLPVLTFRLVIFDAAKVRIDTLFTIANKAFSFNVNGNKVFFCDTVLLQ